jgi:hypothetical protein
LSPAPRDLFQRPISESGSHTEFQSYFEGIYILARIRNTINGDTPQGSATSSAELTVHGHGHRLGLPQTDEIASMLQPVKCSAARPLLRDNRGGSAIIQTCAAKKP